MNGAGVGMVLLLGYLIGMIIVVVVICDEAVGVVPVEDCAMVLSEARTEDELCAVWQDGDRLVFGPLWLK